MDQPGKITKTVTGGLNVPNHVIIPFIEGDGTGPDIWKATRIVIDGAVAAAYKGERKIAWRELLVGEKGFENDGQWLSDDALNEIKKHMVAIKGPLTTPVGKGIRSLNVTIRQKLDLFACIRPVKYIESVPSPMKNPRDINMVVFRENTEDVYAGIEWASGSDEAEQVAAFLKNTMGADLPEKSGIGIKPISPKNTKRLVGMAIQYAIDNHYSSVTLMHKGNIMKFTEGAFRTWGYEAAVENFRDAVVTEDEMYEQHDGRQPEGKILIKDRIADMMFQQVLLRPEDFGVIATPNLNGDYISDALAAQVGGLGMAPGANLSHDCAVFEATHGTAPKYANLDKVNPSSLILSGALMLDHIGWKEAGDLIRASMQETVKAGKVTYDLARQIPGSTEIGCSAFGQALVDRMA